VQSKATGFLTSTMPFAGDADGDSLLEACPALWERRMSRSYIDVMHVHSGCAAYTQEITARVKSENNAEAVTSRCKSGSSAEMFMQPRTTVKPPGA
jgi:hypothetical protein